MIQLELLQSFYFPFFLFSFHANIFSLVTVTYSIIKPKQRLFLKQWDHVLKDILPTLLKNKSSCFYCYCKLLLFTICVFLAQHKKEKGKKYLQDNESDCEMCRT